MLVLSHHKCATTWLSAYVERFAALNRLSFAVTHLSATVPEGAVAVMVNADWPAVRERPEPRLHVLRNPLDIVVSAYHSHLRTHALEGWPELAAQRAVLEQVSREAGLFLTLAFLERDDFHSGAVGPLHALRHWDFDAPGVATLRMEDAVREGGRPVGEWLAERHPDAILPDPEDFAFARFSGRAPGAVDEASHYRSGRAGQWRDELPEPLVAYLRAHFHALLARFYPDSLA
jgi:hypothetical protein